MARTKKAAATSQRPAEQGNVRLYTLEVFLLSGPITEKFARKNPVVSRTIQMRGDQTLQDLHHALFDAFGRWEEHLYEFQFGKGPMDPKGPRYVLPSALQSESGEDKPQIDLLARGARWGSMGSAALHNPIIPRPAHVVKGPMRGQHRSCGKHP